MQLINNLNSTELAVDIKLYSNLVKNIKNLELIRNLSKFKIIGDDTVKTQSSANIEISYDDTYIDNQLTKKNINDYAEFELICNQLDTYITYNNNALYLKYNLDRRSRIYVNQWPVNYQLNHLVRTILKIKNTPDYVKVYTDFFNSEYYKQYQTLIIF